MVKKYFYNWVEFDTDVKKIINYIKKMNLIIKAIYAIPKGGLVLGVTLANHFKVPLFTQNILPAIKHCGSEHILVVDDVSDTGKTLIKIPFIDECVVITLFVKPHTKYMPHFYCRQVYDDDWIVYPWEGKHKKMKRDNTIEVLNG